MTLTQKALEAAIKAMKALEDEATADPENIFGADLTSLAKAALSAALAVDGLCLVPKEPTWEMQIAGRDAILAEDADLDLSTDDARASYEAMIAAASDGEERK